MPMKTHILYSLLNMKIYGPQEHSIGYRVENGGLKDMKLSSKDRGHQKTTLQLNTSSVYTVGLEKTSGFSSVPCHLLLTAFSTQERSLISEHQVVLANNYVIKKCIS